MDDMKNRNILIAIVVLILLFVGVSLLVSGNSRTGTLSVILSLPDKETIKLRVDDEVKPVLSLRPTYEVPEGAHRLTVSSPGYKDFTANFTIFKDQVTTINIKPERLTVPSETNLKSKVISDVSTPGMTVADVVYFYAKTWAFVKVVTPDGNTGYMVSKYDDATQQWVTVLPPGTIFSRHSARDLPEDVVSYMQQNNFIDERLNDE